MLVVALTILLLRKNFKLPNALHIPLYLKDKVDQILNGTHKAKLLIGSGGIYFNPDLE